MKRLFAAVLFACVAVLATPQQYPQMGPDIYNTTAEAAPAIGEALQLARKQGKHVLLDFGANWCVWCHRLHHLFTTDPRVRDTLKRNYITVMVDVNKRNGAARNAAVDAYYGNPTRHGLPVLVVLDASGRRLHTQETGALEEGEAHSAEKVLAFLEKWAPAR